MCEDLKDPRLPVYLSLEESGMLIHLLVAEINKMQETLRKPANGSRVSQMVDMKEIIHHQLNTLTRAYGELAIANDALMGKHGSGRYTVLCLDDEGRYTQLQKNCFETSDALEFYKKNIPSSRKPIIAATDGDGWLWKKPS